MNDLSPAEIEALARAMGTSTPSSDLNAAQPSSTTTKKEKKAVPIENLKSGVTKAQFVQLKEEKRGNDTDSENHQERFNHIKIELEVILGRKKITLEELLSLQSGHVVALDKLAGEPVELWANGKKIAIGEIVIIEDENFGIKILEFIS